MSQNFTFGLKDGFIVDGEPGFVLEPYDQVFVRKSPAYSVQKIVTVKGEVLFEGEYSLNRKNERLSNLIERAGGICRRYNSLRIYQGSETDTCGKRGREEENG